MEIKEVAAAVIVGAFLLAVTAYVFVMLLYALVFLGRGAERVARALERWLPGLK